MLIDCNHDVPEFGCVVRLHQFSPREVERLRLAVQTLAARKTDHFDLTAIEIINPRGVQWSFINGGTDEGLIIKETASYWRLTPSSWENVAGLLEPFANDNQLLQSQQSHQWLSHASNASLLITVNGRW
jgi:hypothetical protein